MSKQTAGRGARGSSGYLCMAFFLALFACLTPYWVWQRSFVYNYSWYSKISTLATGANVASYTSASVPCGFYNECLVASQWNSYSDFNSTICTGEFYTQVGQYGWCPEGLNQTASKPTEISNIEGLTIATTVMLAFSGVLAYISPMHGRSKSALLAAVLAIASTCTSCAALSIAVGFSWYQSFDGSGSGYLPMIADGKMFTVYVGPMYWGIGFWLAVLTCIASAICSVLLLMSFKQLDACADDLEVEQPYDINTGKQASGDVIYSV